MSSVSRPIIHGRDDRDWERLVITLDLSGVSGERKEIARDEGGPVDVDRAGEEFWSPDVRGGTGTDPIGDQSDAVREPVREAQRADEDHARERDRPRGRPGAPREARGEPQDRSRHAGCATA